MKFFRLTIICIMFINLMLPPLSGFESYAAEQDNYVKVGLKYGSSSVSSCTLRSESGFILGTAENRSFTEGMPLPAYTTLVIANENGSIVIRDESGVLLSPDLGSMGCIMPAGYNDNGILYLEQTAYRGGIMLLAKSDGTMTLINYLPMEHYLYGVLNSELSYTNPIEALKAQAVAARSFGEQNLGKHSADGFDLCTGTHCQVYKGVSGEYPSTVQAIDETEGEMIYSNGSPVTAFYFKNSGGYTQNAEDVWANSQSYLKSIKDEYCPSYPWNVILTFDVIQSRLETAGYSPGTIRSVSVTSRTVNGSVYELLIEGSKSTVRLQKEKIRNVLGSTVIKSNRFHLGDSSAAANSGTWTISNGITKSNAESDVYVINGSGTLQKLDTTAAYACNGISSVAFGRTDAVETVMSGTVVFNGFGYGHGVGMPQDSAVEMAKQGFTYDEILEYFYTGIEIK